MKFKGIFITGTDTGVGKTYVGAGIAKALKAEGVNVGVMKPAETGCRKQGGKLIPSDALRLMQAAGVRDRCSLVAPYCFQKPLAPAVAADFEGAFIDPDTILRAYRTLAARHAFMIVEGAGGIMVPLFQGYLYLDLAEALGLPIVIVARSGLGTINHTLLTVSALRERRLNIAGIVINVAQKQRPGLAERTNPAVIEKIAGVPIIGTIPFGSEVFSDIARHLR